MSHVGVAEAEKSVLVLRGTGTAQTVLLPLSDDTDMHESMLVECIGDTRYQTLL